MPAQEHVLRYVVEQKGAMLGTGTGTTFSPGTNITRCDAIVTFCRVLNVTDPELNAYNSSPNPFSDVPAGSYYEKQVKWAYYKNIISGSTFSPTTAAQRQVLCHWFAEFCSAKGVTLPSTVPQTTFPDDSSINSTYKANVYKLQKAGIIDGESPSGNFNPTGSMARIWFAAFLFKYYVPVAQRLTTPTFSSSSATANSITVAWGSVSGATRYDVKLLQGSTVVTAWTSNSTTLNKTFTGLTAGTAYTVHVRAYKSYNGSLYSETATLPKSTVLPVPAVPTNVSRTTSGVNNAIVSWSAVTYATSYKVWRNDVLIGTVNSGSTTTFTDTNAGTLSGQTLKYKVSAVNSAGESAKSTAAPDLAVPAAPTITNVTPANNYAVPTTGKVTIKATGTNASGGMSIIVDNVTVKSSYSSGTNYEHAFNTLGSHTIKITAKNMTSTTGFGYKEVTDTRSVSLSSIDIDVRGSTLGEQRDYGKWCWAASGLWSIKQQGKNTSPAWNQTNFASYAKDGDTSNEGGSNDDIRKGMSGKNVTGSETYGALTKSEVITELQKGKPILANLYKQGAELGHTVVICGITQNSSGTTIKYMDPEKTYCPTSPAPNSATNNYKFVPFDEFCTNYRNDNYVWLGSIKITN